MTALSVRDATRIWPDGGGLRGFSVDVEPGKIAVVVGPSGCGKTTALRIVAGLVVPDRGRVFVGGRDVSEQPPERRGLGVVFQHYALFPNLSVEGNVSFGLKARGVRGAELRDAARAALDLVGLSSKAARRVDALSGGEQQRVAVARALAFKPSVLLLDEPLSNLDLALRRRTREELASLVRKLGIAALHVTHDQEEATAVADDIVVLKDGVVVQKGPPETLYAEPRTAFVARFLGGANVVAARRVAPDRAEIVPGLAVPVAPEGPIGESIAIAWRPESVGLRAARPDDGATFRVESRVYLGADVAFVVVGAGSRFEARVRATESAGRFRAGDAVALSADGPCRVVAEDASS